MHALVERVLVALGRSIYGSQSSTRQGDSGGAVPSADSAIAVNDLL